MLKILNVSLSLALAGILAACASSSPDVIQRGDTQRLAQVGGFAGSGVQREAQVLGVLAGVAGAAAGNAIERFSTREDAVEILVQLKGGDRRAIVQAKGGEVLAAGDAVILVTTGGKIRVTKAPKIEAASPAK